jgi:hypothetical protein
MRTIFITLFNLATHIKFLQETILLSIINKNHIDEITYTGYYSKFQFSKAIGGIAENLLILSCCSFLDEFDHELSPSKFSEYSEKISRLKKTVKPAILKIKSWKGLKNLRNNIIAHNLRINGLSIFESTDVINYNVPSTDDEYVLLADLIFLIAENIEPIFPEIITTIDQDIKVNQYMKLNSDKIDCLKDYQRIKEEIEKIKICT